ncbi:MAG: multidrug transporter AcrB [Caulobacter sp. 12-67-6]|nr:MAG: multidrug transporter AcrB [Caulobacter sp. 12-67-6]
MLSDLSVRRPVFAAVAAIILCVIGLAAFTGLPIRELPNVDPPVVSVSTAYRGASAEVIEERITQVIERQVSGIQGIDRVNSSSRDGRSQINITFTLDRDLDDAANDVRDAVSRVSANLPDQADPPQIAKANADSSPIVIMNLTSTTLSPLELADYADRYLVERMSTVPGVAQAGLNGQLYAMRIWLKPDAMAARGVTVDDVENALNSQNVELPAGALESDSKDFTIRVTRSYSKPDDFLKLPLRAADANGFVLRLGDVARVEEGSNERRKLFRGNGVNQVGIFLTRQSQANDVAISKVVDAEIAEINKTLPPGTKLIKAVDNSIFTAEAIHEVWVTMGISVFLVALVNLVFLGSWRSALIPSIIAPICILSTFIVLAPLGFSLNLLTLLALVLAVGPVVDDAIVVVENIQRRVDEGEPAPVAALRGTRQVFFAVVATTVVLISVFASPMLASKLLKPASTGGWFNRKVDFAMDRLKDSYRHSLEGLLATRSATIGTGVFVLVLALVAGGLFTVLPQELVPAEDRGRVDISLNGPEGAGFDYTVKAATQVERQLEKYRADGVAERTVISVPRFGQSQFNTANGVLVLNSAGDRKQSADQIAAELNKTLSKITGVRAVASVRGAFQRGGGGGNSVDLIAVGNDYVELANWLKPILAEAQANPGLSRPRIDYEPTSPRLSVQIDRDKAGTLGVSAQSIGRALETMFGSRRATTYIKNGQEYDVILQSTLEQRRSIADLDQLQVRTQSGALVPLSTVVTTELRGDTPDRPRVDRLRSVTLTTQLAEGYTVADAVAFLQEQAEARPTPGVSIKWGGQAKDYLEASGAVGVAFGLALLLVFLVLAAQFESWIHPAVIMLTVPLAVLGGLFGLLITGSSINTYSQIGLIILVGIAAKNGILIVEFANQLRDEGLKVKEAVIEAAALRLRPIIMTSIAAAMGALPLMLWTGAGAGSRQTIGSVIFTGAIFATLLTLFVVPVFYNLLARFTKSPEWTSRQIEDYEAREKSGEGQSSPA